MRAALTDEDVQAILGMLRQHGQMATYVIKNRLNMRQLSERWSTAKVLRRMKSLERLGLVERVPTSWAVMITWKAT